MTSATMPRVSGERPRADRERLEMLDAVAVDEEREEIRTRLRG